MRPLKNILLFYLSIASIAIVNASTQKYTNINWMISEDKYQRITFSNPPSVSGAGLSSGPNTDTQTDIQDEVHPICPALTPHLSSVPAEPTQDVVEPQTDQQRLRELFPDFYTGSEVFPTALCDFMQEEWYKPKYDDPQNDIKEECFEELIPFAHELSSYITGHSDNFPENMPEIKGVLVSELNDSIQSKQISFNSLLLTIFRFQAAISPIPHFRDIHDPFNVLANPLTKGLRLDDTWKDTQKSKAKLLSVYNAEKRNKIDLCKYLTLSNKEKMLHKLERKLPLKLPVPILGVGYIGIRLFIDSMLNDRSMLAVYSFREHLNADGKDVSPSWFTGHDYLHYSLQQLHLKIPFDATFSGHFDRTYHHTYRHKFNETEETWPMIDKSANHYRLFHEYLKDFLVSYDRSFLEKMDRYCSQGTIDFFAKNERDNYQNVMIGMFYVLHETYLKVDSIIEAKTIKDIIAAMKEACFQTLALPNQKTRDTLHDYSEPDSYFIDQMRQDGFDVVKKPIRFERVDGDIMAFFACENCTPLTCDEDKPVKVFETFDTYGRPFKSLEGLLMSISDYAPYSTSNAKFTSSDCIAEWEHIRMNIRNCVDDFCDALSVYSDEVVVTQKSPGQRYQASVSRFERDCTDELSKIEQEHRRTMGTFREKRSHLVLPTCSR